MVNKISVCEANDLPRLIEIARSVETMFDSQLWYRGHGNVDWQLIPSAHRRHPVLEKQALQLFRHRAPSFSDSCPAHDDYVGWLPLMQHYRLPTRLLDWTESLLVAAYFAVAAEDQKTDGVVWMLSPGSLNATSIGDVLPFLSDDRVRPIVFEAFGKPIKGEAAECVATLAPRTDLRMLAQLGNFSIHRNQSPLNEHPQASDFLAKVVIPQTAKAAFARDLSIAGIRRSSLFPDLENLARELTDIKVIED